MKLTIERAALMALVAKVQGAVVKRDTIPIVQNVLIRAPLGGEVTISATDLDLHLEAQAPAVIERPGEITAPGAELSEIVGSLPDGAQVGLEVEGSRLVIRAARSTLRLPTLPAVDFPEFATPRGETRFTLPAAALVRLLDKTCFAASRETTRYHLCCVYLHTANRDGRRWLRTAATDGQRLAVADEGSPGDLEGDFGVSLPAKAVSGISKFLAGCNGDVTVSTDGRLIELSLENGSRLTSKLLDGQFPDYPRVLPRSDADHRLDLDAKLLAAAVKRISIVGQGVKHRVVAFEFEPGLLRVTARDQLGGEGDELIECNFDGDPARYPFGAANMLDALAQLDGAKLVLALTGPADPVKFVDPLDPDAFSILMPLRV